MKVAIAFVVLVAILASGCGSDDSAAPPPPTSAGSEELSSEDVEKAFLAEAAGGGVVNLDDSPPKSIECEKGEATQEWRCRISLSGGDSSICIITVDPVTRTVTERSCGRIDN